MSLSVNSVERKLRNREFKVKTVESRSSIWATVQKIRNEKKEYIPFVFCTVCKKVLSYPDAGTSNIQRHVCIKRKRQGEEVASVAKRKKVVPQTIKSECVTKLVDMCTKNLRPFHVVSGDGFRSYTQFVLDAGAKLGPNVDVNNFLPHRTTVSRNASSIADEKRAVLSQSLIPLIAEGLTCATTDIWTEKYRQTSYLTLTLHYIDDNWELKNCVLFTESFDVDERKTNDNIKKMIERKFDELGIGKDNVQKLTFVTDRGPNILAALEKLHCRHFHCNAHLINSVLSDVFNDTFLQQNCPPVYQLLSVCKDLVRYLKKSGDVQKLHTTVEQQCDTRWSTTVRMLISIEKNLADIKEMYEDTRMEATVQSIDEDLLSKLIKLLDPFKEATLKFESSTKPAFGLVALEVESLKDNLRQLMVSNDDQNLNDSEDEDGNVLPVDSDAQPPSVDAQPAASNVDSIIILAEKALNRMDELFNIENEHLAAVFLQPDYNELVGLSKARKKEVLAYVNSFVLQSAIPRTHSSDSSSVSENSQSESDDYARFRNKQRTTVSSEVAEYKKIKRTDDSLLSFWKAKEKELPNLAKLARKLFAIQASSAASERAFSTGGRVLEERRTRLDPDTVDAILFLNHLS